jgi:hypothetical protein
VFLQQPAVQRVLLREQRGFLRQRELRGLLELLVQQVLVHKLLKFLRAMQQKTSLLISYS